MNFIYSIHSMSCNVFCGFTHCQSMNTKADIYATEIWRRAKYLSNAIRIGIEKQNLWENYKQNEMACDDRKFGFSFVDVV